jgi:RNA 2',3'-cyclic 3'-phosphodiesterase
MRLFIGIGLPGPASEALAQIRVRFEPAADPRLRWSAPETWHITLQFLGASSPEQAACVIAGLGELRARPVPMRLEGLGFFARAGIFWAGVPLAPELLALQQQVVAATRGCNFVAEDRPYSPHITLARARGHAGSNALAPLKRAVERSHVSLAAAFTAAEFLLYESFPAPDGSRYEVRARFPLSPVP